MAKRKLYVGQPGTSSAAVYTATNVYASVFAATITNVSAGAETFDVWLVPNGGSATDGNKVYDGVSVASGETLGLQFLINQTLEPGGSIHMAASAGSALTVHISGDVVTS